MRFDEIRDRAASGGWTRRVLILYGSMALGLCGIIGVFAHTYWQSLPPMEKQAQRPPLVIVINKANPVKDLSLKQLSRIYSGEVTSWPNGVHITAINRPIDSDARDRFFQSVFKKKQAPFFQPGSPVPFETMRADSDEAAVLFVSRQKGAITYCYISCADGSVKVITVGGHSPDEKSYALR